MSVEIEVGLENAAEIPGLPEDLRLEEPPKKGLANPKVRRLLMIGGVVLVAILVGLLLYYHNRESTDDAQVDGCLLYTSNGQPPVCCAASGCTTSSTRCGFESSIYFFSCQLFTTAPRFENSTR